jgi:hypothetical protein
MCHNSSFPRRADQTKARGPIPVPPQCEFERPLTHIAYLMRAMTSGDSLLEKVSSDELRSYGYKLISLGRGKGGMP